jgi:hypothetical protein
MGPGPMLQTRVVYDQGSSWPVQIAITETTQQSHGGSTIDVKLNIAEDKAIRLASVSQNYDRYVDVEFESEHGWVIHVFWLTVSGRLRMKFGQKNSTATFELGLREKEASNLCSQIRGAVFGPIQSVNTSQEIVYVSYTKGTTHPISFSISKDGGAKVLYDVMITEDDAHKFANLLKSFTDHSPTGFGTHPNDILSFVSKRNCKFDVRWWNCVVFRIAIQGKNNAHENIDISDDTAHELYKKIKEILCGPASNMKSKKTEECPDCKGKGYIPMLNRDVDCDCVK